MGLTQITTFDRQIYEIGGFVNLAFLRGLARLHWSFERTGTKTEHSSESTDLLLLKRDAKGRWRVFRQI